MLAVIREALPHRKARCPYYPQDLYSITGSYGGNTLDPDGKPLTKEFVFGNAANIASETAVTAGPTTAGPTVKSTRYMSVSKPSQTSTVAGQDGSHPEDTRACNADDTRTRATGRERMLRWSVQTSVAKSVYQPTGTDVAKSNAVLCHDDTRCTSVKPDQRSEDVWELTKFWSPTGVANVDQEIADITAEELDKLATKKSSGIQWYLGTAEDDNLDKIRVNVKYHPRHTGIKYPVEWRRYRKSTWAKRKKDSGWGLIEDRVPTCTSAS